MRLAINGRHYAAQRSSLVFGLAMAWLLSATPTARAAPAVAADTTPGPSTAFFYGKPIPLESLAAFDQVVVDPDNLQAGDLEQLQSHETEVFAYVSLTEARPSRSWYPRIDQRWVIGRNPGWTSAVLDPRQEGWRAFVVERVAELWKRGFRALFLDTLDSYQLAVKKPAEREACVRALVELIRTIHRRFPGIKLLPNRGFELFPAVAELVVGVAAESLFAGWNPARGVYQPVSERDRSWLLDRLQALQRDHGLAVIVLDYLPPREREQARATARRIADLGFIPWVATPAMDTLGVGLLEPIARRVLVLYDSREAKLRQSDALLKLGMPLEYLGYLPEYVDVRSPLPQFPLRQRYAGVVTWFANDLVARPKYRAWLLRQIADGVPVAIFGCVGFQVGAGLLGKLGLRLAASRISGPIRVADADRELLGFETPLRPLARGLTPWAADTTKVRSHLALVDRTGHRIDPIITSPWGGLALDPYLYTAGHAEHTRWILNPFTFLQRALKLPRLPVPDVTTENGSRLLTTHVDGDGFVSRAEFAGNPYAGRVILERILKPYPLPTTFSIIEGEIAPHGLHPDASHECEELARRIFRLPHVEIASHAYSHPFDWIKVQQPGKRGSRHRLPIPGYRFALRREIEGSIDYINGHLAPPDKSVRVFLWSGETNPDAQAVALTHAAGVLNVNGGDTTVTDENPSYSEILPMGRPAGAHYQVHAPITNENVFTNSWRGPFYGYRKVLETFRLTDLPRRIKPLSIYYHPYSGTKVASVKALEEVYRWAMAQQTLPLWISEYAIKVEAWRALTLFRRLDGSWQIHAPSALRTLRLDAAAGWPDLARSRRVAGVRELPQGRYVALAPGEGPAILTLRPEPPPEAHLLWSNAPLIRWQQSEGELRFRLRGHLPVKVAIADPHARCRLEKADGQPKVERTQGTHQLTFRHRDTGDITFRCR